MQSPARMDWFEPSFHFAITPSGIIFKTIACPLPNGWGQITIPILSSAELLLSAISKPYRQTLPKARQRAKTTKGDGSPLPLRTFVDPAMDTSRSPTSNRCMQQAPSTRRLSFHASSLCPTFVTSRAYLSSRPADERVGASSSAASCKTMPSSPTMLVMHSQHCCISSTGRIIRTDSSTSPPCLNFSVMSFPSLQVHPPHVTDMILSPVRTCSVEQASALFQESRRSPLEIPAIVAAPSELGRRNMPSFSFPDLTSLTVRTGQACFKASSSLGNPTHTLPANLTRYPKSRDMQRAAPSVIVFSSTSSLWNAAYICPIFAKVLSMAAWL
mmetsp:Transcript_48793/g.113944  ORF Transcript_48793/g.113944 Transcript_48793/m.113944 type:complete len:328 (-) Transcript_48793:2-985(-)